MGARFLLIAFLFGVLLFSFFVSAVSSDKVGYVYNKDFKIDNNVVSLLESYGYNVEMIKINSNMDLSGYDFIFVGDERFRNPEFLPVGEVPTIVASYYHSYEWGLTDRDGVSRMGSVMPLKVSENGNVYEVYSNASFKNNHVAIPYYYLNLGNKIDGGTVCSAQSSSSGNSFGDVVSYFNMTEKVCFFGIVESDYWTPQARNLFEDCVGFVSGSIPIEESAECSVDSDCSGNVSGEYCFEGDVYYDSSVGVCNEGVCGAGISEQVLEEVCSYGCYGGNCLNEPIGNESHDVGFVDFSNSFGGIRIELTDGTDILDEENLTCGEKYKISVTLENKGDFVENVSFAGNVGSVELNHLPVTGHGIGVKKLKSKTITLDLSAGNYMISIEAFIDGFMDANLVDNVVQREIVVDC